MSYFWPKDLDLKLIQSPEEILNEAKEEFLRESDGLISLDLTITQSVEGNDECTVRAISNLTNRSVTLFRVVSRSGYPFPNVLVLQEDSLPPYLMKNVKKRTPGVSLPRVDFMISQEVEVPNEWVSSCTSEFRKRLQTALTSVYVKSCLTNISCFAKDYN